MTTRTAYASLLIPALVWCAGFLVLPLMGSTGDVAAGEVYGRVCHQLDERSFAWFGVPWAVCIRCSSIYLAFTAMLVVVPIVRGLDRWTPMSHGAFALCLLPAAIDALLSFTGLHPADTLTRSITGTLAGVGLGLTIPPLFFEAVTRKRHDTPIHHSGENDVR